MVITSLGTVAGTIVLDKICDRCNGEGKVLQTYSAGSAPRKFRCGTCSGRGTVLTDVGETMIDFIATYLPNNCKFDCSLEDKLNDAFNSRE